MLCWQGLCISTTGTNIDTCQQTRKIPYLFLLHHSRIGLTLQTACRIYFLIHRNIPDPLNYRLTSISRHHHMYVKIIQKVPVPPEVSVSLFDSYNNLVPTKSFHFFPRTLLLTTTLRYIKSEQLWYAYILGNWYRPRRLPNRRSLETEIDPRA